jgi:hypothetical protein
LEQALDLLACVSAGPPVEADALLQRLAPHLSRLSCVVVVSLGGAGGAHATAERIRGFGVACKVIAVGDASAAAHDLRTVAADAIERGEALAL